MSCEEQVNARSFSDCDDSAERVFLGPAVIILANEVFPLTNDTSPRPNGCDMPARSAG